jgi:hypothetical protein
MFLSASIALLVVAPTAHAQGQSMLVIAEREPTEVMLLRLSATSRCQHNCFVRGAPYSAERVVESVQVLADGNRIVQRRAEQLYRDADGRSRVESEWRDSPLVQIQDPVGNMSYRLYPRQKTGLKMVMAEPAPAASAALAIQSPGSNGVSVGAARVAEQLGPTMASATTSADSQRTVRPLGTRQMDGLTVEGSLQNTTIASGKSGNTLPIVSTVETWHSHELNLDLYVKSNDPRYGEQVTRVQNIRRNAPPASLFAAPADYAVREVTRR